MKLNQEEILKRYRKVAELGYGLSNSGKKTSDDTYTYDIQKFFTFKTSALSFLKSVFGESHQYYQEFLNSCVKPEKDHIDACIGIMETIRIDLSYGWLDNAKGLISAEIFTDFMAMASHLLENGYKDPAAVLIGGVLEAHLRQLCEKNGISLISKEQRNGKDVPKMADEMNNDLQKKAVYTAPIHRQVLAWLAIRNKAAHGEYDQYDKILVEQMYDGVLGFMVQNPA
jgi:hypothetical protein